MSAQTNIIDLAGYTTVAVPWSVEAEQSVLGCLLLDNAAFEPVRAAIEGKHFYSAVHRLVFETIEAMLIASRPADVLTVYERLKQAGKADEVGGQQYLLDLMHSVASVRNAGQYAGIVRGLALRRLLVDAAAEAQDIAKSCPEPEQALDQIAALFSTIERTRSKTEPRLFADALAARCEHWTSMESGEVVPGVATRLPTLDHALGGGIKPGRVIVLAARPSVGKTSLAQQIALAVADQGQGVLILSQEMPEGELIDRAAANLAEVNLGLISEGKLTKDEWPRLTEMMDRAPDLPLYIDDQPAMTLLEMRAKARQVQKRAPLALVVVDYLQLCAGASQRGSRHHEIEAISRGLKSLAKELNVCILLLSQINRASTQRDEPTLADLKESGAIEEDADVVIFLQPKGLVEGQQLLAGIIAKNRHGRRGRVALSFHGATQRWVESTADVSRTGGA